LSNKRPFFCAAVLLLLLAAVQSGCEQYSPAPVPKVYGKITADSSGCYIGAFVNGNSNISSYETLIGKKLACVMWYVSFTQDFPVSDSNAVIATGSVPCITWEPWRYIVSDEAYSLQRIIDGDFDAYITAWAAAAKAFKYPMFLRFAHEMNGNWYPWDGYHNGASSAAPAKFISAWRHVHDIFSSADATNVTWVWNVNAASTPGDDWNKADNYYPGDSYVDWIAIDGYNWGTSGSGTAWQDFDSVFSSIYSTLIASHPGKPVMIGEMASTEDGGDKAAWITDAFSKMRTSYTGIKCYNWFNINKETDWRVNSSGSSAASFSSAMTPSYYISDIPLN